MRGRAWIILPLLVLGTSSFAQQDIFRSRISLIGAVDRYIGDIDQQFKDVDIEHSALLGISLQRSLTYGTALYGQYSYLRLSANDLTNGNTERALNFRTEAHTFEMGLVFRMDNGRILRYDARFAPFASIGAGIGTYNVFGDLYNANGGRYQYWNDGTIRDIAEQSPFAGDAQVIDQNGSYETELTHRNTGVDKPKDPYYFFIPAKLGLKWRISDRLSADLFYGFNWTFTDLLDDIHGDYPTDLVRAEDQYISNPTSNKEVRGNANDNDHYHYAGIALSWSFGRRSHAYRVTPLYVDRAPASQPVATPVPPVPPTPKPEKKPVVEQPKVYNIQVESITIGKITLDTLVVGAIIRSIVADTSVKMMTPLDPILRDTAPQHTLRRTPGQISVPARTVGPTRMQTILDSSVTVVIADSADLRRSDSSLIISDTTAVSVPDSGPPVRKQVADSAVGSRRFADPRKTVINATDSLSDDAPALKIVQPVITAPTQKVDTIRATPVAPMPPPPARVVPVDTTTRSSTTPVAPSGATPPPARMAPEPAPKVAQSPPPNYSPPASQSSTTTRIVTVPVPVIVNVPAPQQADTGVTNAALLDSLSALEQQNAALQHRADSFSARPPTLAPREPAAPGVPDANATLARHTQMLNDALVDQVTALERYVALQNETGNDSLVAAQRKQIMELDATVEQLRDSLSRDRASMPAADIHSTTTDSSERPSTRTATAVSDTIFFTSGSFSVNEGYRAQIKTDAARILAAKSGKVIVTGNSDLSGDAAFNLMLSQKRADEVVRLLIEAGVPKERIVSKGLGEQLARKAHSVRDRNVIINTVLE